MKSLPLIKATSKNVIPAKALHRMVYRAKAGIQKSLTILDSRRSLPRTWIRGGSDKLVIIRGTLKCLFIVLTAFACVPVVKNPAPLHDHAFQVSPYVEQEYRIQIGDQLDIKFFYNPELNEQVTVRPDGRISLQLVHELKVAGLTPSELTDSLTRKYAPELKKPEITVIVRSFGAHRIYVDGEVNKSGMFPLMGLMTVMQAISQAGGVKDTARTKEVVVIRHGADNKRLALQVNMQKVIDGTDIGQDIALKPFDIVYVPRSSIANVDVWVDQYVRRVLPFQVSSGFGYYYSVVP